MRRAWSCFALLLVACAPIVNPEVEIAKPPDWRDLPVPDSKRCDFDDHEACAAECDKGEAFACGVIAHAMTKHAKDAGDGARTALIGASILFDREKAIERRTALARLPAQLEAAQKARAATACENAVSAEKSRCRQEESCNPTFVDAVIESHCSSGLVRCADACGVLQALCTAEKGGWCTRMDELGAEP